MRYYIVVFNRPWKTIVVTKNCAEAQQAYQEGPKAERRLLLAWNITDGLEIFQADLHYLKWTAMQPKPLGLCVLSQEDMSGLRALLENELIKKIVGEECGRTVEMPHSSTEKAA